MITYQEALDSLFSQLPMYQRQGAPAFKKDLSNTYWLCEYFENPQSKFKSIHIAGTNGKGSVSHFLASVLQEAGCKVGLYTSPHLKDFRERIRINGEPIHEDKVIDLVEHHLPNFKEVQPSFFEMTVALAFKHFADEEVDVAVVETGLGGRLDSTNVLVPELSIITNIGWDHQQFLGDTLLHIATEKAGIIKRNVPVVVGKSQPETDTVFLLQADELNATLHYADEESELLSVSYQGRPKPMLQAKLKAFGEVFQLESPLPGTYQAENILTVACAVQELIRQGWTIGRKNFRVGIANTVKNTGILGRWQTLSEDPLTICDCGHNIDGVEQIVELLKTTEHNQLHIVWGMVSDKDPEKILSLLPKDAHYHFCAPDIPRAMPLQDLEQQAQDHGLSGTSYGSVSEALVGAQKAAKDNDLIFIGGSTFVVAEVV